MSFFSGLKNLLNPLNHAKAIGKVAGKLPGSNIAGGVLNPLALGGKLSGKAADALGRMPGGGINPLANRRGGGAAAPPPVMAGAQDYFNSFSPEDQEGITSSLRGNANGMNDWFSAAQAAGAVPSVAPAMAPLAAPAGPDVGAEVAKARQMFMAERGMKRRLS